VDDNTFKVLIAFVGSLQIIAIAYLGTRQARAVGDLREVRTLVNGLAHEKDTAIASAAGKQGELIGRDHAASQQAIITLAAAAALAALNTKTLEEQRLTAIATPLNTPIPVSIVADSEHPIPVHNVAEGESKKNG
jgi:hypothetical protein